MIFDAFSIYLLRLHYCDSNDLNDISDIIPGLDYMNWRSDSNLHGKISAQTLFLKRI